MDFSEEELQQIFDIFKAETEEHLENINKCLLDLEKNPTDEKLLSTLFRDAHTIKGAARMLGIPTIQSIAHKIEDFLKLAKDNSITINSTVIDLIYKAIDLIGKILSTITCTTFDYQDENANNIVIELDLLKDKLLANEKKNDNNKPNHSKTSVIADKDITFDGQSPLKFIKKHVVLLDNKFQKDDATNALLDIIDDELSKDLREKEKEVLTLTKKNLLFIKDNKLIPAAEIIQVIELSLKSLWTNTDDNNLNPIIDKLKTVYHLLALTREREKLLLLQEQNSEILKKSKPQKSYNLSKTDSYIQGSFKTLRVDTDKLDYLENQSEELIVLKIKNKKYKQTITDAISEIEDIQKQINKALNTIKVNDKKGVFDFGHSTETTATINNLKKQFEKANEEIETLRNRMSNFQKSFFSDDTKLNFLSDGIENTVKSIRILPLATIFHMFPRMVRDISRSQNKQAEIIITGSETGADKTIIEELKAPLIHIINNAIDHGIESPEERIKKGKNPTGKIILNSYQSDNSIIIEIIDDGKGLDNNTIKEKALSENFITQKELEQLSPNQITKLIFWPGFSTRAEISELSGRGIGLDVVHNIITQIGGRITIKTKPDEGFKITLKIPTDFATTKALLVKTNKQIFAISSNYVKGVTSITNEDIFTKEGKPHIIYNDMSVKIASLSELLGYEEIPATKEKLNIVIIQHEESLLALEIDDFVRTEEIIQKKLNPPLTRVKNISGISSLADGESCFILNMTDILKSAFSATEFKKNKTILSLPTQTQKVYNIMLVDDSYTTLMLMKNILKAYEYNIVTATNGIEALNKLSYEKVDIIVTDLEMPKMDGIEFIKNVREKDKHIPVLVLTSHTEKLSEIYINNYANEILLKKDFSEKLFIKIIKKNLPN